MSLKSYSLLETLYGKFSWLFFLFDFLFCSFSRTVYNVHTGLLCTYCVQCTFRVTVYVLCTMYNTGLLCTYCAQWTYRVTVYVLCTMNIQGYCVRTVYNVHSGLLCTYCVQCTFRVAVYVLCTMYIQGCCVRTVYNVHTGSLCTCKGLDCKDDLKLFKYDDLKFKLYFLTLM